MSISCPSCSAVLKTKNIAPGTKAKCPKCSAPITVPSTAITPGTAPVPAESNPFAFTDSPSLGSSATPAGFPSLPGTGSAENPRRKRGSPLLWMVGLGALVLLLASAGAIFLAMRMDGSSAIAQEGREETPKKDIDVDAIDASGESPAPVPKLNPIPKKDPDPKKTKSKKTKTKNSKSKKKSNQKKGGGRIFIADFMGSRGSGERFCIIADSSLSMNAGILIRGKNKKLRKRISRLDYLKMELLKTVKKLQTGAKFSIILFDAKAYPMPGPDWRVGGTKDVQEITPWVLGIKTHLKTFPYPAFQKAFQLKPRPDVIFFMTDGQFRFNTWQLIAKLNKQKPKTVIHTIQLTSKRNRGKRFKKVNDPHFVGQRMLQKFFPGKQKAPKEVAAWVDSLKKQKSSDMRTLVSEMQMRIIAAQSGGTFRIIRVEEDNKKKA